MVVNRENKTNKLREEEDNKWDIPKASLEAKLFEGDHFDKPKRNNDDGQQVNKDHFVKFKEFVVPWGKDKRDKKEKDIERILNHPVANFY